MRTPGDDLFGHVEQAFLFEIRSQCQFGLRAAGELDRARSAGDVAGIFYAAQALLVSAGIISRLLWPAPGRPLAKHFPNRGERLRALLNVRDDSPLGPTRTFRNHLEHFDERLEKWASDSQRHNIVDQSVLSQGAIAGIDPGDMLRNFDPTTNEFTYRGDKLQLRPLVDELRQVATAVNDAVARGILSRDREA